MNFKDKLEEIRKDNSRISQLNRIKKIVGNHKIKYNPILSKMKRDDWIIDNNNKHVIAEACKLTMTIVMACLYPNELNEAEKEKWTLQ